MKIQDMTVEEFMQLLKDLQRQYLEPQIKVIVQGEIADMRADILAGYPKDKDGNPDVSGHRYYHESLMENEKNKAEFWRKLTFELSKWGLICFAGWILIELWQAFLRGPKP